MCPLNDLHTALFEHPEDTIGCLTAAVMIVTAVNGVVNPHLRVRVLDFEPLTPFKDIKSNFVGRVLKMNFECELCGTVMQVVQMEVFCNVDIRGWEIPTSQSLW